MNPILFSQPIFTPASLYGGLVWYDASNTPVGAVASWTDQFGNYGAATQGTGGKQPVCTASQQNGLNALLFTSASSQTLALPAAIYSLANNNNTMFMVAKRNIDAGGTEVALIDLAVNTTVASGLRYYLSLESTVGKLYFQNRTNAASGVELSGITNTIYNVFTCYRSGTTQSIQANNGTAVTNTNGQNDNTSINAFIGSAADNGRYLDGGMAELIIYGRALSAAEILAVNTYLKAKWGTP